MIPSLVPLRFTLIRVRLQALAVKLHCRPVALVLEQVGVFQSRLGTHPLLEKLFSTSDPETLGMEET